MQTCDCDQIRLSYLCVMGRQVELPWDVSKLSLDRISLLSSSAMAITDLLEKGDLVREKHVAEV